ncbi:MAG: transporter transrane protein [Firmicutes bacterium]|nr:transporter transrane protein [Bacillota bacterium]
MCSETMYDSDEYPRICWFVLAAGIVMMFFTMLTGLSFAPLIGVIAQDLSIDIGTASFGFMGLMMLTNAIFVLLWGVLVDKIGIFRVIIMGLSVLLIAHLLYPMIGYSYATVVFLRILTGLGGAAGLILIEPIVSRWIPFKQRGFALGLNALSMAGAVVGLSCVPRVVSVAGHWQVGLGWLSVPIAAGLLYTMLVAYFAQKHQTRNEAATPGEKEVGDYFGKVFLRSPAFWLGLLIMAFSNWVNNAFNDLGPGFLAVAPPIGAGYGPEVAGHLASGGMIGIVVGIFIGGIVLDKVFKGRSGILVMAGFILCIILYNGIMLEPIYSNTTFLSMWILIGGITSPFTSIGNQYFAVRTFSPNVIGKVVACWTCISNFVGSFGVMISAYAIHITGSYRMSFAIMSGVCILGFIAAMASRERRTAMELAATE